MNLISSFSIFESLKSNYLAVIHAINPSTWSVSIITSISPRFDISLSTKFGIDTNAACLFNEKLILSPFVPFKNIRSAVSRIFLSLSDSRRI